MALVGFAHNPELDHRDGMAPREWQLLLMHECASDHYCLGLVHRACILRWSWAWKCIHACKPQAHASTASNTLDNIMASMFVTPDTNLDTQGAAECHVVKTVHAQPMSLDTFPDYRFCNIMREQAT